MDKKEWPAISAYAERNNVPNEALGDNPIQFLRDMSISCGPAFTLREQEEYARFVEMKRKAIDENQDKSCHCVYHPDIELVNGLCSKCQYGPRSERTCRGCRWHWSAPSGDGSAGTADHKCLAVNASDDAWGWYPASMQDAKFIDELNHTQYPQVPSWCPCVQIPVTEEQVEFAERLPAIQCDKGHLDLMRQNTLLQAEVSQLKAGQKGNSEEYYAEIRRFHAEVDKKDGLPEGKLVTIELTPLAAQEVDRLCLVYGLTIAELFRQVLALLRENEDTGNEEGSGIPSQIMPAGVQCTSCGELTSNDGACTQCGAAQKENTGVGTIGGTEVALLKENVALRSKVSQLELALDEIYCSVRRTFPYRLKDEGVTGQGFPPRPPPKKS